MFCLDEYIWNYYFKNKLKNEKKNNKNNNKNKQIKFNNIVKVIIIPNRKDFCVNNMLENLWWSSKDLIYFKQTAHEEIFNLIKRHKYMTIQQASKLLYQPGNMTIKYDSNNFN